MSFSLGRPWYKNVLALALMMLIAFGMILTPQFFGFDIPESVMTLGGTVIGSLGTLAMNLLKTESEKQSKEE